jgi:hypothetical protein
MHVAVPSAADARDTAPVRAHREFYAATVLPVQPSSQQPAMSSTSSSASAGYSGTPLPKKLGIKPGHRVRFDHAPPGFAAALGGLPPDVAVLADGEEAEGLDLVVFFTTAADHLRRAYDRLARSLSPAGMLWVAWPKKASGVRTDLTEDVVRAVALENGMVDTKVCAIDATWSGLRLVYRLEHRPPR